MFFGVKLCRNMCVSVEVHLCGYLNGCGVDEFYSMHMYSRSVDNLREQSLYLQTALHCWPFQSISIALSFSPPTNDLINFIFPMTWWLFALGIYLCLNSRMCHSVRGCAVRRRQWRKIIRQWPEVVKQIFGHIKVNLIS